MQLINTNSQIYNRNVARLKDNAKTISYYHNDIKFVRNDYR